MNQEYSSEGGDSGSRTKFSSSFFGTNGKDAKMGIKIETEKRGWDGEASIDFQGKNRAVMPLTPANGKSTNDKSSCYLNLVNNYCYSNTVIIGPDSGQNSQTNSNSNQNPETDVQNSQCIPNPNPENDVLNNMQNSQTNSNSNQNPETDVQNSQANSNTNQDSIENVIVGQRNVVEFVPFSSETDPPATDVMSQQLDVYVDLDGDIVKSLGYNYTSYVKANEIECSSAMVFNLRP